MSKERNPSEDYYSSAYHEDKEETDEEEESALESIKRWFLGLTASFLITMVTLFFLGWAFFDWQAEEREQRIVREAEQREQDRITRAIEVCRQSNKESTRNREFAKDQLVQVLTIFSDRGLNPDEIEERYTEEFEQYEEFVNDAFPYRQCSRNCVSAYVSPDTPNCLPAQSEDGAVPKDS